MATGTSGAQDPHRVAQPGSHDHGDAVAQQQPAVGQQHQPQPATRATPDVRMDTTPDGKRAKPDGGHNSDSPTPPQGEFRRGKRAAETHRNLQLDNHY